MHSGVEVARRVVRNGANPIGEPGNVLFRRDDFAAAGGWRSDLPPVMDLDLWMRLLQYGEFLGLSETLAAFRIGRNTLSAADEGEIYQAQRALTKELGDSALFQVRGIDLAVGRMLAPVGRFRRRTLYAMSRKAAKRAAGGRRLTAVPRRHGSLYRATTCGHGPRLPGGVGQLRGDRGGDG